MEDSEKRNDGFYTYNEDGQSGQAEADAAGSGSQAGAGGQGSAYGQSASQGQQGSASSQGQGSTSSQGSYGQTGAYGAGTGSQGGAYGGSYGAQGSYGSQGAGSYGAQGQGSYGSYGTQGAGSAYGAGSSGQNGAGSYGSYGTQGQGSYGSMGSYGSQGNSSQGGAYQGGAYQGSAFQPKQDDSAPGKKQRRKKERKPGGFGVKLCKCAAIAAVFGLVAGVAFEGVQRVSDQIFGEQQEAVQQAGETDGSGGSGSKDADDGQVKTAATSSTFVGNDYSDIVSEVRPSVVAITNISEAEYQSFWGEQTYEVPYAGTGIIVSEDDKNLYIATNDHVVKNAKSLTVTFDDESTVSAEIKGTDPSIDIAVIRVSLDSIESGTMDKIKIASLGDSDKILVGQPSIAIGNALGYGQSVTIGYISALNREVSVDDGETSYTAELIQTDAAINPGNSGGALLNAEGKVIGINSVKYSDTDVEGIGYAIPINTAMPIIDDLITKEKVDDSERASLGITVVDVTSEVAEMYGLPEGVCVQHVEENSASDKAGILRGDILTEFDGKKIVSNDDLENRISYYRAGDVVDVTVMRADGGGYQEHVITVELGSKR